MKYRAIVEPMDNGCVKIGTKVPIDRQSASQAKGMATNDRLRAWRLFDLGRGSDHKKDALRHMALRVGRELKVGAA